MRINEIKDFFSQYGAERTISDKERTRRNPPKIAFLSTIVINKTTKTEKLIRLLKYPQKPIKLVPGLRKNDLTLHKRYVNASLAVHNDLKWHTGGTLSIGEGKAYSTQIK